MSSKRGQFIIVSFLLTFGLMLLPTKVSAHQPLAIFVLSLVSLLLAFLVLRFDLKGIEFLTLLTLPVLLTLGVGAIFFFFPNFSLTFRFLLWSFFAFLFYVILLAENVFNVARGRPIPLLRAARTTSFLATLLVAFLLYTAIYKGNFNLWVQLSFVILTTFLLALQSLWTVDLPEKIGISLVSMGSLLSLGQLELALGLAFLPIESFFRALALSTGFYILLGIGLHFLRHTLTRRVMGEYVAVAGAVTIILLIL